jgi:hypothetical protein
MKWHFFTLITAVLILSILPYSAVAKNVGLKQCNAYVQNGQYGSTYDSKTPIITATLEPKGELFLLRTVLKGGEENKVLINKKFVRQKTSEDDRVFRDYEDPIKLKKDGSFIYSNPYSKYICVFKGKLTFLRGAKEKIFS